MPPKKDCKISNSRENKSLIKIKEEGIFAEYFSATLQYQQEYGPNTLVLMQVGAFFESYGLKDAPGGPMSRIEDFCRICELKLAEKSKDRYQGFPLYMAGFGEYNLEKYIRLLTNAGFHCVVFVQEDDMRRANTKKRVFQAVYSAGTFLSLEDSITPSASVSNHTMCCWVHTFSIPQRMGIHESRYLCGFAVANILSGQTYLYEYTTNCLLSPTSFDDLERAVMSFTPTEIIFLHADPTGSEAEQILQFTGMSRCSTLHRVKESCEKAQRLHKKTYIDETLGFYLGDRVSTICQEFTTYEFATRCFVYLLDFLQSHNPDLVRQIAIPVFNNQSSRVILANHTLKQLNLLGPQGVVSFLNGTQTAMGSRLFQYQCQNPTFDVEWIQREYNAIEWTIQLGEIKIQEQRKRFSRIRDLERIGRRLLLGKIYPSDVFEWVRGIREWSAVLKDIGVPSHMEQRVMTQTETRDAFIQYVESHICLEVCEGMNHFDWGDISRPLFVPENSTSEWNNSWLKCLDLQKRLQSFTDGLNGLLENNKQGEEWVKIHETAKSGCSLQITTIRGHYLQDILKRKSGNTVIDVYESKDKTVRVECNTFKVSQTGGVSTIDSPLLQTTCKDLWKEKEKLASKSMECYQLFLRDLEKKWSWFMKDQVQQMAEMDVLLNKAYQSMKYRYCRPQIVQDDSETNDEQSFFDAKELRHVLIEHLQTQEIYVANDLTLGEKQRGILLFGTNAVGKTSLIKAAGIAVWMAQIGMYVPAQNFRYRPYRAIYSRILGNDDIFRGLSTFVVEMSELRVILKNADKYSLVLGDELCSGTETESALSIFVAGLKRLISQEATFLFATHFHEIVHYEEIIQMTTQSRVLQLKHLSVLYDRERQELVYDRKLKDGSGEAIYGLEVAKSLFMPTDFIEDAFLLRSKYFPTTTKVSPLSCKQSRYNAKKIKGLCEICMQKMGEEVHHVIPQHLADNQGFLEGGHVHKNHKANLKSVCNKCHQSLHIRMGET